MPISIKVKAVFSCKCIHCGYEWEADTKPKRCADCKRRSWNGEDHRFANPYSGRDAQKRAKALPEVPVNFQIEIGTAAPRPPSYESMLGSFVKARTIIEDIIECNPCNHKKDQCVCAEIQALAEINLHIGKLIQLKPRRSTYLAQKKAEAKRSA
jgi:hypothetical protein